MALTALILGMVVCIVNGGEIKYYIGNCIGNMTYRDANSYFGSWTTEPPPKMPSYQMSMFAQSYDKPNETILAQGNFNYYYHKEDTNVNDALFHLWWDLELNGDAVALVAPTVIPGIPDFSIKHHDCWDKSTQIPKLAVFYWWFNDTDTKESCMNKFTSSMPQCNS